MAVVSRIKGENSGNIGSINASGVMFSSVCRRIPSFTLSSLLIPTHKHTHTHALVVSSCYCLCLSGNLPGLDTYRNVGSVHRRRVYWDFGMAPVQDYFGDMGRQQ